MDNAVNSVLLPLVQSIRKGVGSMFNAGDAIKLGLPGVGDWADNEKLWKVARLGGGKAVHAWPSSP